MASSIPLNWVRTWLISLIYSNVQVYWLELLPKRVIAFHQSHVILQWQRHDYTPNWSELNLSLTVLLLLKLILDFVERALLRYIQFTWSYNDSIIISILINLNLTDFLDRSGSRKVVITFFLKLCDLNMMTPHPAA